MEHINSENDAMTGFHYNCLANWYDDRQADGSPLRLNYYCDYCSELHVSELPDDQTLRAQLDTLAGLQDDEAGEAIAEFNFNLFSRFQLAEGSSPDMAMDGPNFLVERAWSVLGLDIRGIDSDALGHILFAHFPAGYAIEPEHAGTVIVTCRTFLKAVDRMVGLPHLAACLARLDEQSMETLRAELADSTNWSMAKIATMDARRQGYDLDDPEQFEQWSESMRARMDERFAHNRELSFQPGTSMFEDPGINHRLPQSAGTRSAKKQKRKNSRRARRKNRR